MPRIDDINVFNIAKTTVLQAAVLEWLHSLDAHNFADTVALDQFLKGQIVSDPAFLVALAAKRCYMIFEAGLNPNVTKVRSDMVEYLDNVLKQKHGSVLEHATYTFAIEGCSRVFTAEMNRHRAGWAISEGSLRYIRFSEIPYWLPPSLDSNASDDDSMRSRKAHTRMLFERAFRQQGEIYDELVSLWDMDEADKNFAVKKVLTSQFRRIVGMGVATGGIWTGNLRALRHVLALRTEAAAEEEIAYVFGKIGDIMLRDETLFADFDIKQRPDGLAQFVPAHSKV